MPKKFDNPKEQREKQLSKKNKSQKKQQAAAQTARNAKEKKNKYVNEKTSPIRPSSPISNSKKADQSATVQQNFFFELFQITFKSDKISNYDVYPTIKNFAIGLFLISVSAYVFIRHFILLPHERTVQRWISEQIKDSKVSQFDLSNVNEIITNYIEDNNLTEQKDIKVVLGVDAFSVKPNLLIDKEGFRRGTIEEEKVDQELIDKFHKNILAFEEYSKQFKKSVIRDTFVYLVQPLLANYSCFIIHLSASTQGKATLSEIETLLFLAEQLEKFNFKVESLAFDGDTSYSKLIKKWNKNIYDNFHNQNGEIYSPILNDPISKFKYKITVDPLHLLKRWRYRLFKGKLHQFFHEDDQFVNIFQWQQEFGIPSLVLTDKQFLKMNDELPISLFDPEILLKLYEKKDKPTLSYFVVPSIFLTALNSKKISKHDRENLLEFSLYYLLFYNDLLKSSEKPLTDRPYKNNKIIRMMSTGITSDTISTLSTLLYLIKNDENSTIYLHRIGSNPVEHTIGHFRMLSKNQNTYHKLKKIVGKKKLFDEVKKKLNIHHKISGRIPTLGEDLMNSPKYDYFDFNPKILAYSFFKFLDFNINQKVLEKLSITSFIPYEKAFENVKDFFKNLENLMLVEKEKCSGKKIISTTQFDSVETVNIQQRIYGKGSFFNN